MNRLPYQRSYVFGTQRQINEYIRNRGLIEEYEGKFNRMVEEVKREYEEDYGEKLPLDTIMYIAVEPDNRIFAEGVATMENIDELMSVTMDGRMINLTTTMPEEDTDEIMADMFRDIQMEGGKKRRIKKVGKKKSIKKTKKARKTRKQIKKRKHRKSMKK